MGRVMQHGALRFQRQRLPVAMRQVATHAAHEGGPRIPTSRMLVGAAIGATAAATAGWKLRNWPAIAAEANIDVADLHQRLCDLETAQAGRVSSAFVFIKPHAVTDPVKNLVAGTFASAGIRVLSEGSIGAEEIDSDMLIDTHYGAIAAKAMKQKPSELVVQQSAQDAFKKAFGISWPDAVKQGLVFNLVDGAAKLGITKAQLGDRYDVLKKGETLLKFGGGFYCGKVDNVYVINGFYARMRMQFTAPGTSIHYYVVEWDPSKLSWADFRAKVLGTTDPKTADPSSLRNQIFRTWQELGIEAEPNTGNNGVHASASPFEALAERANWLRVPIQSDSFGRALLACGVPLPIIKDWCDDPAVMFEGKKQSLFDLLEDLDGYECLRKSTTINACN